MKILKAAAITAAIIAAFFIGKSQEVIEVPREIPSTYINLEYFEDFYCIKVEDGTELHLIIQGEEYLFLNYEEVR